MNLYTVGASGIMAAEARISTTAHNIANMGTAGYSRQSVMTSTADAQAASIGFIGRGVKVDSVMRQYDAFLHQQLTVAQGEGARATAQASVLEQLTALVSDRTQGISPALSKFFAGVNALASSPGDAVVRQDLLGQANRLVVQINDAYAQIESVREGINDQLDGYVSQANAALARINDLNHQVVSAQATGQPPNDLLDQRDAAVNELNQLVGIEYSEHNGSVEITLSGGQALLLGDRVFQLESMPSSADPSSKILGVTLPGTGGLQAQRHNDALGGKIGGALKARDTTLNALQANVGQMAVGLAQAFNAIHAQGTSLSGRKVDFFTIGEPQAIACRDNTSAAGIKVQYKPLDIKVDEKGNASIPKPEIEASDYEIRLVGDQYKITRLSDGVVSYSAVGDSISVGGLDVSIEPGANAGDTWTIMAARFAGRDLALNIKRGEDIAAADAAGGAANGQNALKLARLETQRIFSGGTASVSDVYANAINQLGAQTQNAISFRDSQTALIAQKFAAHQSVSGINANEEYTNLTQFQAQYQASAKVIDTATKLFDTVLGLQR